MIKRILMTADTVGGVWTYALELTAALAAHNVEVVLATMGAPLSIDQRNQISALDNVCVFESAFKLEWMDDPWSDLEAAGEWLLRIEDQTCVDVVHLNGFTHGTLSWNAPVLMVGHSCVLSWWRAVRNENAPKTWARYAQAVANGLRAAGTVVAPSRAMLDSLLANYGFFANAQVIPNGRDSNRFSPAPKQNFIFAAGRLWDEAKNFATLDSAAQNLAWPVHVAGNARHGDGKTAHFETLVPLGVLSEPALAATLARAAIYALPARYEPFGLSVLEASLCGCALVLGDKDTLRENWDGVAMFVDPEDADRLHESLKFLINNESQRNSLAEAALSRARSFSSQRMAESYVQQYEKLLVTARSTKEAVR